MMRAAYNSDDPDHGLVVQKTDYELKDNGIYNGEMREDDSDKWIPHGKGSCEWPDGTLYIGDWKNGKFSGEGDLIIDHDHQFTGGFSKGLKSGKGVYKYRGIVKEGIFKKDKLHGFGKETHSAGGEYEGMFVKGQKEG